MRVLFIALLLVSIIPASSQKSKPVPDFGKISTEELKMKECSFDKTAEAMVLFDVADVYSNLYILPSVVQISSEFKRHVRIKILNDKGLKYADIHIPYFSLDGAENIRNLIAQTYNLDAGGNIIITKLEKKLVYDRKVINKMISEQVFTFPDVKAGSILEYQYQMKSESLGELKRWNFQANIPVLFSRYSINFPPEFEVSVTPKCSLPFIRNMENQGARDAEVYYMENIPALKDEPFMTTAYDYLEHLEPRIVAVNSNGMRRLVIPFWPDVVRNLMENDKFGIQLKKNIQRTADLDAELKKITDPYQKMTTIFYYVRKNMEWSGIGSIWAQNGVKEAWKDKKGTAGEINFILINLLKDADLDAHPILVSTKENGRVNAALTSLDQFDKVMAYVKLNKNIYVLDATDKYTPPNLIPLEVMYSDGLVIENPATYSWGWKSIWNQQRSRNYTIIKGSIDEKGNINGTASISSIDYARIPRAQGLKAGKEKFIDHYFTSLNPGVKIDSFRVENENVDSLPLVQSFSFSRPLGTSGNYSYFTLNMFSGLEKNEFLSEKRVTDVFFGSNQFYYISGNLTLPETYSFEELPENVRMITPDTSIVFTRRLNVEGNQLGALVTLEFKKPVFTPGEYPAFMQFYKKLFDMLNEQIVIKKK